jgi:negative regulator of flagellin synthesis FlgM
MQVNGPSHVNGAQPINGPHATRPAEQTAPPDDLAGSDEVSISPEADLLSRVHNLPEIRQERVDQIRAEIANGTYETDEKLDIAISRLLDEMA